MQVVSGIRKKNRTVVWIDVILACQVLACWGCVLFVPGFAAHLAWFMLKCVYAPIGIVILLVQAWQWGRGLVRSREIAGSVVSITLSVAMCLALLPKVLPLP